MPIVETRHGAIRYEDDQVIRLLGGLVGFDEVTQFVLLETTEIEPLRWLVSVERPELSFLVVDPRLLVEEFQFGLSGEDRKRLRIDEGSDLLPLAITVLGPRPESSTANLKAPIVINSTEMLAAQIVLTESSYSVQHPLLLGSSD